MTTYTVYLYREMRLVFTGIEAGSPEAAVRIASATHTDDAVRIEDCEGSSFAALVEHAVADDHVASHVVYREEGRLLCVGPRLLNMLHAFVAFAYGHRPTNDTWSELELLAERARALLRKSKGRRPA